MVTPELKWPSTYLTSTPANLLATETPCFGSEASSPNSKASFWPRTPPLALMSSTACWAPFCNCSPKAAFGPVSGPATPIRMSALATPANARPSDRAMPAVKTLFMRYSPGSAKDSEYTLWTGAGLQHWFNLPCRLSACNLVKIELKRDLLAFLPKIGSRRLICRLVGGDLRPPCQRARALVEPRILANHLAGAGEAKTEQPENQDDDEVDDPVVHREQRFAEHRHVDEPRCAGERGRV